MGPSSSATRTRTPTLPKMVRLVKSNRSRAGFRYSVMTSTSATAMARAHRHASRARGTSHARRAALVVAQQRHDDENEDDDPSGLGDADGRSAREVAGKGDEPHGHGEKSHRAHERKAQAPTLFKPKGDGREEGDEQRGDKRRLGEVAERRSSRVAGQRREKRARLREERHGEQTEQEICYECRDDDGKQEHSGHGRGFRGRASGPR